MIAKLKRRLDNSFRGQIGIVTLAIGMVPMILTMLIAGYLLSDAELEAGLSAELNKNQKGFQAQIILNQILETNNTRDKIRRYPNNGLQEDTRDEIESVANEYLSGHVAQYDLHIFYPDSPDVEIKSEDVGMGSDHARSNIASPEGGTVYVRLDIGGRVAQAYENTLSAGTTPATDRHPGYGDYH